MRKIREVKLPVPDIDVRIIIEDMTAELSVNGKTKSFDGDSELLICLIQNRNQMVKRKDMQIHITEGTLDKNLPNALSRIRKKLSSAISPKLLETIFMTDGKGQNYWAKFCIPEENLVFTEELAEDILMGMGSSRSFSRGIFPDVRTFTGGWPIRTDLLPICIMENVTYANLHSFIYTIFMEHPLCSSMVVSAVGGGGKTFSLLRAYEYGTEAGGCVFYIRADALAEGEHNLLHYIAQRYLKVQDYHQHTAAWENFLAETDKAVLLLVDGMNEVSVEIQTACCKSFLWMQQQYPKLKGVFVTRFPQILKARLYQPMEVQLLPLSGPRFDGNKKMELLTRLQISATPLIVRQLEDMAENETEDIHSRYDLQKVYFDSLADQAGRRDGSGWIYHVLGYIAAASMEGTQINGRWLKKLCSDQGDYDFIHRWCAGEEYPLEEAAAVEKLKATGFLMKGDGDTYTIHQQYRDYLAVRYGMLLMGCGETAPAEFLGKIIDATRYFRLAEEEDLAEINHRRHNNMDLGEFGFYAGLSWYQRNQDDSMVPLLVQLGIQVAYLYDNVKNYTGLYNLYCCLDDLLQQCFRTESVDPRLNAALPGYYFCLNKLVTTKSNLKALEGEQKRRELSGKLEEYYQMWLANTPEEDVESRAIALSGLGGVYLARYSLASGFEERDECLSYAVKYHTEAMQLRRSVQSPRLYHSYAALGTDNFYKGENYLKDPKADRYKEAVNILRQAAEHHRLAAEEEANNEKHVSLTRMAGCWYKLFEITPSGTEAEDAESRTLREEYRSKLYHAAVSSCRYLINACCGSGVLHHGGEIKALLMDMKKYMSALNLTEEEYGLIDQLCGLYHQAFSSKRKPQRNEDNTGILF